MSILAPHKEQDGWVYVRVPSGYARPTFPRAVDFVTRKGLPGLSIGFDSKTFETAPMIHVAYDDVAPTQRVISSRRVEEAVENEDYLAKCAGEGLVAVFTQRNEWAVGMYTATGQSGVGITTVGAHSGYDGHAIACAPTLREAYYRYKAATR